MLVGMQVPDLLEQFGVSKVPHLRARPPPFALHPHLGLPLSWAARQVLVVNDGRPGADTALTDLLDAITSRPKVVHTREMLRDGIWGPDWFGDDHVVDVHIGNLRKKIDSAGDKSRIETVRGVGFRLARLIEERTSERTIVQQLAYLMRAGEPDALDRMVGFAFGALAVQLVERKEFGRLVALKDGNYCHEPLEVIETGPRHVDVKRLYDENRFRAKLSAVEGMPMFLY